MTSPEREDSPGFFLMKPQKDCSGGLHDAPGEASSCLSADFDPDVVWLYVHLHASLFVPEAKCGGDFAFNALMRTSHQSRPCHSRST